jgi:non-specific serine/threonine protein kinase
MLGDYREAQQCGDAALEEHTRRGDARGIGLALVVLANTSLQRGDLAHAGLLHEEAGRRLREAGNPGAVVPSVQLGLIACELNDAGRARQLSGELEAFGVNWQQPVVLASALQIRGLVAASEGNLASAVQHLERALALVRPTGDQQVVVMILTSLGHVYLDQAQTRAALDVFAEATHLARASGERVRLIRALEGYARSLAETDPDAAVRLAAATGAQREILGTALWPTERGYLEAWLARARQRLGTSTYQHAWEDGHASTLERAVDLVDALDKVNQPATSTLLSAREQTVAALIARGLTNKQIAAELVVSAATIRTHVEHILTKLDLRSRAQVAVWASREGLVPETTTP